MSKKSFILHIDSLSILDELTDEQAGQLFKAIKSYQKGEDVELNQLIKIAFSPFKNQFARDEQRDRSGENHWNWKGGITEENNALRNSAEYANWRKNVFIRDGFACIECGKVGCVLNAHHIKPWATYPEYRFDVDNGVTLCVECHKEAHRA